MQNEWTDQQIFDLLYWKEKTDLTYTKIGEKIGRSASACQHKYKEVIRDLDASEADNMLEAA